MELPLATSKTTSLVFKSHRREPELISPAKPTPRELKVVSDVDDQYGLRYHVPMILFYRHKPSLTIKGDGNDNNPDPVQVIRKALAETLVYYYPFAGRLREGPNGKLLVDCNAEGALFVEADADVALDDFGQDLHPPFPCLEELHFEPVRPKRILKDPLLRLQVTRLKCGGFVLAFSFNHVISDASGSSQLLRTLGEFIHGSNSPSIPPVWDRHLLTAKVPARVTHVHHEYDFDDVSVESVMALREPMVRRSFFFGPDEMSAIRRLVPPDFNGHITTFEHLVSFLWRCRTIALRPLPETRMRLGVSFNPRAILRTEPLPAGYYGNVIMSAVAIATARELSEQPLELALKRVQEAKSTVTEEYTRSLVDLLGTVRQKRPVVSIESFAVSHLGHIALDKVDLGWGPAVYGSIAEGALGVFSFFVFSKIKNKNGIVVQMMLPAPAMERFSEQLAHICVDGDGSNKPVRSSL